MQYTQVELTSPTGATEVWWLPVPAGKAAAGEKITRARKTPLAQFEEDWKITKVCVTLSEENLPSDARIAKTFHREAYTTAYMTF